MGLGAENGKVVESLDVCKSKGNKKKKKKQDGVVEEEDTGCWLRLRFFGSCISSRSKVDSSVSGTSTNYGNLCFLWKNYCSYDVIGGSIFFTHVSCALFLIVQSCTCRDLLVIKLFEFLIVPAYSRL